MLFSAARPLNTQRQILVKSQMEDEIKVIYPKYYKHYIWV